MMSRLERLRYKLKAGLYRTTELRRHGLNTRDIEQLIEVGAIKRLQRGLYRVGESDDSTLFAGFAEISKIVSSGVVCLYSALAYYDLTTFVPPEIYLALPIGAWRPKISYPPVRYFTFSPTTYRLGQTEIDIDGTKVLIYEREKTVCDCMRFRNKFGLDVALEGLKAYLRQPDRDISKLLSYAAQCHIRTVLTPYLEAFLA